VEGGIIRTKTSQFLTYSLNFIFVKLAAYTSGSVLKVTDLIRVWAEEQKVEGDGCHQIDDEPASEVMDSNLGRLTHNLVVLTNVRCPEIDQDVDDEHDINCKWKNVLLVDIYNLTA